MKVILLKELKGKGGEGDVIDVARGFANNYLLTQGYAVLATKGNRSSWSSASTTSPSARRPASPTPRRSRRSWTT